MNVQDIYSNIETVSKSNPMISGIVSLYGLGLLTYFLKDLPKSFFGFLTKHFTTSVHMSNNHDCFIKVMNLFEATKAVNKLRCIKFLNGKWGGDDKITKGVGIGSHIMWYNNVPILVKFTIAENNISSDERMSIVLVKLGRSHKLFDNLLLELQKESEVNNSVTRIFRFTGIWEKVVEAPVRNFDTIFIEDFKKKQLIDTLTKFYANKEWYLSRGIPYQLGILLHGNPGTGKTSIIKALAGHFHKDIYILPVMEMSKLQDCISTLPKNCFLVIEDVDACSSVHERKKKKNLPKSDKDTQNNSSFLEGLAKSGMSEILNAIDGLVSLSGRILIMTTNHYEDLDEAFVRKGRVDLTMEISYVTVSVFKFFLSVFYDIPMLEVNKLIIETIKPVTIATLQTEFMEGMKIEEIVEKYII